MRKITTDCIIRLGGRLWFREVLCLFGEIAGRRVAVEQSEGPGGIHRAVAAMHVLAQLRARSIAPHADDVPAVVHRAGSGFQRCGRLLVPPRAVPQHLRARHIPLLFDQKRQVNQRVVVRGIEIQRLAVKARRPRRSPTESHSRPLR